MQIVIQFINASLHVYIFSLLFSQFWARAVERFFFYISLFVLISTLTVSLLFLRDNPVMYLIIFIITFSISLMYNCKFSSKIIFSLIFLTIGAISEVATAIIINTIFSVDFLEGKQGAPYITGMLISKFILVIVVIMIKAKKHAPLLKQYQKNYFSIFLFPISTLLLGIAQHRIFLNNPNQPNGMMFFILICYTLLIIANFIVFDFIDTIYINTFNEGKLIAAQQIIVTQTEQYKEIIAHNKDIAKIQHDNNHLFLGLLSELKSGNVDKAIQHLEIACDINEKDIISGENIVFTIIRMKKELASSYGIEIDYHVRNINGIIVESTDLAIILGNALNNAIDACKDSKKDMVVINLFVVLKNDMVFITIENPVEDNVDVKNLISNKGNDRFHGFGIISMKTIAKKYDGDVTFSCNDKVFETTIFLMNKKV